MDTVRALTRGSVASGLSHSTEYDIVVSLIWAVGFVLVFAPIAIASYWYWRRI